MPAPGRIVIVTGPPGSGKTTAARAVASRAEGPAVHLEADYFWDVIRAGFVPPYLPASQAQNETVMAVVAGAAATYARGGYLVLVDGIVGPWFLGPFRTLPVPVHYVVLRPRPDVAEVRVHARPGAPQITIDGLHNLYRLFGDLGPFERHVVDVGALTPEQVVAALADASRSVDFALPPV